MDPPPVQYVRTSDGYDIAYGVSGGGPPIVVLPYAFEHVQLAWQYPVLGDWLSALATRFTVVQLDTRGSGLSTRSLRPDFAFEHFQRDIEVVFDRLRLDHVILWCLGAFGVMAAQYAIDNPKKVRALILTSPVGYRSMAFWTDVSDQDWETFLHSVVPRDRSPVEARRQVELLKQSIDQETFVRRFRASRANSEIRHPSMWEQIVTPTLVLHARDYALADVAGSVQVAQLARASLTLIDGTYAFGDPEQGIRAIESFLARIPAAQEAPKVVHGLSYREVEVLRLVAAGKSNQQIADALVISPSTILHHVTNILTKTGCSNRTEAAAYAHRHSLT